MSIYGVTKRPYRQTSQRTSKGRCNTLCIDNYSVQRWEKDSHQKWLGSRSRVVEGAVSLLQDIYIYKFRLCRKCSWQVFFLSKLKPNVSWYKLHGMSSSITCGSISKIPEIVCTILVQSYLFHNDKMLWLCGFFINFPDNFAVLNVLSKLFSTNVCEPKVPLKQKIIFRFPDRLRPCPFIYTNLTTCKIAFHFTKITLWDSLLESNETYSTTI